MKVPRCTRKNSSSCAWACQTNSPFTLASLTYWPLAMATTRGEKYSVMASNSWARCPMDSMFVSRLRSGMQPQALRDLVDLLAVGVQAKADEVERLGRDPCHRAAIVAIVARGEELARVDRRQEAALERPAQ